MNKRELDESPPVMYSQYTKGTSQIWYTPPYTINYYHSPNYKTVLITYIK
ncbi:hypothetical protein HanXRQr2_Chr12g0555831 [Helianthus annuus]|uniref:Uncharacterized protein n=1 Tax=Helianthus annuus TaxID=4232 RepID=A0A9K3HJ53_HELAN|nr:hypothetical protein HanXRQr2_Chr12g0555831 [Helianthus annuus]KAJ0863879.1 hypothetical protein HanPSC8_Chr12g0535131 [Helianthus annuus]